MALKRVRFAVPEEDEHPSQAKAPSRAQSTAARLRRTADELLACLERNAQLEGELYGLRQALQARNATVQDLEKLNHELNEGRRKRDRASMEAAQASGGTVADLLRQLAACNAEKHQLERRLQEAERRLSAGDSHAVASQPQQQQQQQQPQQQQQQQGLAEAPPAGGAEEGGAGGGDAAVAVEPAAAGPVAGAAAPAAGGGSGADGAATSSEPVTSRAAAAAGTMVELQHGGPVPAPPAQQRRQPSSSSG